MYVECIIKEGNVLFNDTLNTFIYDYIASNIWIRTTQIKNEGNVLFNDILNTFYLWLYGIGHMIVARVLLWVPSHRQDRTSHGICYTSRGALTGTRNSSMGPP